MARLWLEREAGQRGSEGHTTAGLGSTPNRALDFSIHDRLRQLGRFRIDRRLGKGGFGVVYLAYDTVLNRDVALKLPHTPVLADADLRQRFLREGTAVAGLHHPCIVPVYEAGQESGLCFLASAYCSGPTLSAWRAEQSGSVAPQQVAQIMLHLSEAVHHAHQRGMLHRDLKPSNVLLDESASTDSLPFTPKVTDFGLAKPIQEDLNRTATATGVMVGTPRYMAPEQAAGRNDDIGPATDVYGLGAILYELLTGRPPLEGGDNVQTLHRVLDEEPIRPRRVFPTIPRDLEAICQKCLEKDVRGRYAGAGELADDFRRFLAGEATHARPASQLRSWWRCIRRHPTFAALIAALLASILLLIAGLFLYNGSLRQFNSTLNESLHRSRALRIRAEASDRRAQLLLYAADMKLAARAWQDGDLRQAAELLQRHVPQADEPDRRDFLWHYLARQVKGSSTRLTRHEGACYYVRYSPDGRWVATAGSDDKVHICHADTGRWRCTLDTRQGEVNAAAFASRRPLLATAGDDGTVKVWNLESETLELTIQAHEKLAYNVLFTPDDSALLSAGYDPVIRIWDLKSGSPLGTLQGHTRAVEWLALSPDGRLLGSASSDETAILWDLETRSAVRVLTGHSNRLSSLDFSPDGKLLATGAIDRSVRIWETDSGRTLSVHWHLDGVQCVRFAPDGEQVAAGDRGGSVQLWPTPTSADQRVPESTVSADSSRGWSAHVGRVYALAFSPDGQYMITGGSDGDVNRWKRKREPQVPRLTDRKQPINDFTFCSDHTIAFITDAEVGLWDVATREVTSIVSNRPASRKCVAYSRAAKLLAVGDSEGNVEIWQVQHRPAAQYASWSVSGTVASLAFTPNGQQLAVVNWDQNDAVMLLDADSGQRVANYGTKNCNYATFSPLGCMLAADRENDALVWGLTDQRTVARLQGHASTIGSIAFSPDARLLATASKDRTVKLWDLRLGKQLFSFVGHRSQVRTVAFSGDGRILASGGEDQRLILWHTASGRQLCQLDAETDSFLKVAFSPDGQRLAWLLGNGALGVHDAAEEGEKKCQP